MVDVLEPFWAPKSPEVWARVNYMMEAFRKRVGEGGWGRNHM